MNDDKLINKIYNVNNEAIMKLRMAHNEAKNGRKMIIIKGIMKEEEDNNKRTYLN